MFDPMNLNKCLRRAFLKELELALIHVKELNLCLALFFFSEDELGDNSSPLQGSSHIGAESQYFKIVVYNVIRFFTYL